jgi:hypothetical protein
MDDTPTTREGWIALRKAQARAAPKFVMNDPSSEHHGKVAVLSAGSTDSYIDHSSRGTSYSEEQPGWSLRFDLPIELVFDPTIVGFILMQERDKILPYLEKSNAEAAAEMLHWLAPDEDGYWAPAWALDVSWLALGQRFFLEYNDHNSDEDWSENLVIYDDVEWTTIELPGEVTS